MDSDNGLKIEYISVDHVMPYQYNARTHSDDQVAQIAGSMTEFGFVNPILIDDNGGIIAGHGRLMAARMLGIKQVPAIRLKHLSETQRRALMIADNKIAENAGWDENLLHQELQALEGEDFNLSLLGFGEDELDELLGDDDNEGLTDENAAPEAPEKPVSVLGDLWVCGDHKILCGDSALIDSYQTLLGEELADMVFTDPPYNVNYANSMKDKMRGKARPIQNDNLGDDFGAFLYDVCTNLMMVNKGALYICMSSSELHTLYNAFTDAGGKWSTFIIWAKNTFTLGRADYQRQYEPILYGWKNGNEHFWCGARDQSDVWFVNKPAKNDLHPTMKPVELVERALHNSSKTKDIVLDAFGGSGTTMIACEKTGRRARLAVQKSITGPLFNMLGSSIGGGGFFDSILGSIFHEGGEVGGSAPQRRVPAYVFASAPRYHSGGVAGLKPGEIPAILERGEVVLPKDGTRMGSSVNVVMNISTPDANSFRKSQSQITAEAARGIQRAKRNL